MNRRNHAGKRAPAAHDIKPISKTSFLPSLSLGGYYSGSESGDSDVDNREDRAAREIRKNRRGQRARQQLAEWKYGKNAKHLQNEKAKVERNAGWDIKRGAVGVPGSKDRRTVGYSKEKSTGSNLTALGDRQTRPKPKPRDDQGPIHPSWEAAKRRKQQTAVLPTFAGKKITFD
jgi:hypothetical protein